MVDGILDRRVFRSRRDRLRPGESIDSAVVVFGPIASLFCSFFSIDHRRAPGALANVGVHFLMISFGPSYGFMVMARTSPLIGLFTALFRGWPAAFGLHRPP